jgi:hypothetical protein
MTAAARREPMQDGETRAPHDAERDAACPPLDDSAFVVRSPTPVTPLRTAPTWACRPLLHKDLTPREVDVARLLRRGLSYRLAGLELGLSHHTVATHVRAIIRAIPSAFKEHEGTHDSNLALGRLVAVWIYRVEEGHWPDRETR